MIHIRKNNEIRKYNEIYDGVKKLTKLKDKNSALYLTFSMVFDN